MDPQSDSSSKQMPNKSNKNKPTLKSDYKYRNKDTDELNSNLTEYP